MPSSIIGTGRGLQPATVGYGEKTDTATAYGGMTLWWEREGGGGRKIGQGGVGRGGAVGGGGVGVMARDGRLRGERTAGCGAFRTVSSARSCFVVD
jgi:hypothetical protein